MGEALGLDWVGPAGTYASPNPAVYDAINLVGDACELEWAALDDDEWSLVDFTPSAGSSLIDAGRFLMRADGAGTSATTIAVRANGGSSDPADFFIGRFSYLNTALAAPAPWRSRSPFPPGACPTLRPASGSDKPSRLAGR